MYKRLRDAWPMLDPDSGGEYMRVFREFSEERGKVDKGITDLIDAGTEKGFPPQPADVKRAIQRAIPPGSFKPANQGCEWCAGKGFVHLRGGEHRVVENGGVYRLEVSGAVMIHPEEWTREDDTVRRCICRR